MKNKSLSESWRKIQPDETDRQRMLTHILDENRSDEKDQSAYNSPKEGGIRMKKMVVAVICGVLILLGTVAFAGDKILDLFSSNNHAINKAVAFEYVQNVEMDYVWSDGLGIKVDSFIMDDVNLVVVLNYNFKEKPQDFTDILIMGTLTIKDEQGNVICEDGNINSLARSIGGLDDNNPGFIVEDNIVKQVLSFANDGNFPVSQKLYFSLSQVGLHDQRLGKDSDEVKALKSNPENRSPEERAHDKIYGYDPDAGTGTFKLFLGDWAFSFDVEEKFTQRERVVYSGSKENINVTATLSPTGMSAEIELPYIFDGAAQERLGSIIKLTDSTGNVYTLPGYGVENSDSNKTIVSCTFPVSLFDAPDSFTLIIEGDERIMEFDKRIVIEINKVE